MRVRYPDKWLRIVGIPFLAVITRHLGDPTSLFELLKKPAYYADIAASLFIVFTIWEMNRRLIGYFDEHYSWLTDTFKRLVLQMAVNLGLSAVVLTVAIFTYQIPIMHREEGFFIEYLFASDVPISLIFVVLINGLYAMLNLVQTYEVRIADLERQLQSTLHLPSALAETEKPAKKNLVVTKGSSMVPLPTDEIAYIYKQNDYNFVKTFENQEYRIDYTLDQLAGLLSEVEFYRVNRQMIARMEAIKQVQQKEQGGLVLRLQPQFIEEVTVSKKKAADFKAWIDR